jgi:hypothetical protein
MPANPHPLGRKVFAKILLVIFDAVAERLGRSLQNFASGFDSRPRLQF